MPDPSTPADLTAASTGLPRRQPMFRGDLRALSNMHVHPFYVPMFDRVVPSSEHAFNAAKTTDPTQIEWVLSAPTPRKAKDRGRQVTLRPGWDTGVRVSAMRHILHAKFLVPELRAILLSTGLDTPLVETNHWGDNFWGDAYNGEFADVRGINMLGELLMELRFSILASAA